MARKRTTQNETPPTETPPTETPPNETTQAQPNDDDQEVLNESDNMPAENVTEMDMPVTPSPEANATETDIPVTTPSPAEEPDIAYDITLESVADKLSPKSAGVLHFQLARRSDDGKLYLRLERSEGGGLHTKEWIDVQLIVETIRTQGDRAWKSSLLKTTMLGKSSNNCSFLAACLRSPAVGLIKANEKNAFLHHQVDDFEEKASSFINPA